MSLLQPPPAPPSLPACVVEKITDGDTIRCRDGTRVRMLGIDAPELSQKPHGQASRRALERLAPPGSTVLLQEGRTSRDKYGRRLAYVLIPGTTPKDSVVNANLRLVADGFALRYRGADPGPAGAAMDRAEAEAKAAKRGLWGTGGFDCDPRDRRRRRC